MRVIASTAAGATLTLAEIERMAEEQLAVPEAQDGPEPDGNG